MKLKKLNSKDYSDLVDLAIREDIGSGDITTQSVNMPEENFMGVFTSREVGVLAGIDLLPFILKKISPTSKTKLLLKDGAKLKRGSKIAIIKGPTSGVLLAERIILNFLQRLSGIATITNQFVSKVEGSKAKILDTRKTTPGWRILEKYAVLCGGGENHRMGLYDMVMIKDNHISSLSHTSTTPIREAVSRARNAVGNSKKILVEVDNLIQMAEALSISPDIILLDNMDIQNLKKAVQLRNKTMPKILLEASGGVNLKTVQKIAKTGVDRISIGALTHSVKALDIGLDS